MRNQEIINRCRDIGQLEEFLDRCAELQAEDLPEGGYDTVEAMSVLLLNRMSVLVEELRVGMREGPSL